MNFPVEYQLWNKTEYWQSILLFYSIRLFVLKALWIPHLAPTFFWGHQPSSLCSFCAAITKMLLLELLIFSNGINNFQCCSYLGFKTTLQWKASPEPRLPCSNCRKHWQANIRYLVKPWSDNRAVLWVIEGNCVGQVQQKPVCRSSDLAVVNKTKLLQQTTTSCSGGSFDLPPPGAHWEQICHCHTIPAFCFLISSTPCGQFVYFHHVCAGLSGSGWVTAGSASLRCVTSPPVICSSAARLHCLSPPSITALRSALRYPFTD